jgi:N-acetylneuraminate lyase
MENAVCSRDLGLSAIAVQSPYYFKPDETRLAEFVTKIGEAVPEIPVYYYHIPDLTGVCLSMSGFLTKISGMLSSFAGIKYSGTDLSDYMSCLYFDNGQYDILWGRDECLLAALATGAKGAVGSSYNYLAPLYLRLIDEFRKGNISRARSFQYRAVKLLTVLQAHGGIPAGKAMMKYLGLDCGQYRLPLKKIAEGDYDVFAGEIRNLGLEEYFSKL